MQRKPLSKRTRFEVFKRDLFTCGYCGGKTPNVVLEVDHIIPVSKGGKDHIDNLITSCFDCNRGKSDKELSSIPLTLEVKAKIAKEKEKQYLEYKKTLKQTTDRINNEIQSLCDVYEGYFPEYYLTEKFKGSIRVFVEKLGYYEVESAMHNSCSRFNSNQSLKYFCGICWNKIKGT